MKIDFGYGRYLEADAPPRDTPHHKRIVGAFPIENTRTGYRLLLECGHEAVTFGNLAHAEGRVLCMRCRDAQ
jgi:hypothetical protein